MKIIISKAVACALFLTAIAFAFAQNTQTSSAVSPEKAKDIRLLFQATNPQNLVPQVMDQLIAGFKQAAPNVPDAFWDEFKKKVDVNEIVDLMIPIYDKYFSAEDIKTMLAFYVTLVYRSNKRGDYDPDGDSLFEREYAVENDARSGHNDIVGMLERGEI